MLGKVRPAGLATADRRKHRARDPFLNQSAKGLQTGRRYPAQNTCLNYDWRSSWQQIGAVATERVLPRITAAREQDCNVRAQVKLPLVDWKHQS